MLHVDEHAAAAVPPTLVHEQLIGEGRSPSRVVSTRGSIADSALLGGSVRGHLALGEEGLGEPAGRVVGIGPFETHPDLEARGSDETAKGVDRRGTLAGLIGRHRGLARAGACGQLGLRDLRVSSSRTDQVA